METHIELIVQLSNDDIKALTKGRVFILEGQENDQGYGVRKIVIMRKQEGGESL